MSRRRPITATDLQIIRSALNRAIEERESYADAYSRRGPEAERALAMVAMYEKLHVKLFGEPSAVEQEREKIRNTPAVSIFDISGRGDK
jgi:hypothetical protein